MTLQELATRPTLFWRWHAKADNDAWIWGLFGAAARRRDWRAARRWLLFTRGYYRRHDGRNPDGSLKRGKLVKARDPH